MSDVNNGVEDDFDAIQHKKFNDYVRMRILHVLGIYPKLSMSMIQVGIGTSLSPRLWKGVLEQLMKEGLVKVEQATISTPTGRAQVHIIVSLVTNEAKSV